MLEPLKELPDQPLTFEIDDNNLEIFLYFQNGRYNFIGVNGDEYPTKMPMDSSAVSFSVEAQQLLNGIGCTLFATAEDELRPIMNGIFMDILKIAFLSSLPIHTNWFGSKSGHCPRCTGSVYTTEKPANLLKAILPKESGKVELAFDSKNACFKLSDFVLNCRLIEGNYPNYNSVIPTNNPNRLIIDRALFVNVLRRVSVFADAALGLAKLQLKTGSWSYLPRIRTTRFRQRKKWHAIIPATI